MKNKIIASVLAVALFVGMAVPAFAGDFYSSVAGDANKASIIDFYNDGKVIKEYTMKNGEDKDMKELARVFENKDTMILDETYLDFSLEGDTLAFGINDSTVTCIDTKGTATLVVKSTINDKVVGKLVLKAAPAVTVKNATGFRFASTNNVVTVGDYAEASKIKIVSVPAGSKFTSYQTMAIDTIIQDAIIDVLQYYTGAGTADLGLVANKWVVAGLRQGEKIKLVTDNTKDLTKPIVAAKNTTVGDSNYGLITVTIPGVATAEQKVVDVQTALRKISPAAQLALKDANGDSLTKFTTTVSDNVAITLTTAVGIASNEIVVAPADDDATRVYTVPANKADKMTPASKKTLTIDIPKFLDGNNNSTERPIKTATSVEAVKAVKASKIGGPASITLEVGEVYNTDGKIKYGPSNSNVGQDYSIANEYTNADATVSDYGAVEVGGKKIMGVKVGTNKVIATLAGSTETSTIIVKVIAKGAKVPEAKPTLGWTTSSVEVGKNTVLAVKNATGTLTFSSSDDKIATVDKAGKITGVKDGTATISVKVGEETLKATVTVKTAAPAKPEVKPVDPSKPTTNPSTGVALLGQLF